MTFPYQLLDSLSKRLALRRHPRYGSTQHTLISVLYWYYSGGDGPFGRAHVKARKKWSAVLGSIRYDTARGGGRKTNQGSGVPLPRRSDLAESAEPRKSVPNRPGPLSTPSSFGSLVGRQVLDTFHQEDSEQLFLAGKQRLRVVCTESRRRAR